MRRNIWLFVVKLLCFGLILCFADWGIGKAFQCFRDYAFSKNPQYMGYKSQYAIEKADEEMLIIGSSTASHNYIPQLIKNAIGYSVYNCAEDGCFFIYNNLEINLLLERYSPKYILWEIGEDCLSTNYDEKYKFQSLSRLYPYYKNNNVRNIVNEKDKNQKYWMLSKTYRYNSILDRLIYPFIKKQNLDNGYVPIENSGYKYPTVSKTIIESDINYNKVDMLENTFQNCINHNTKVIITSSPRLKIDKIKSTTQYQTLLQICNEYNVPFIDFYNVDVFIQDSTLFKDINHMNDKGTRKYMEFFIPELKKVVDNK